MLSCVRAALTSTGNSKNVHRPMAETTLMDPDLAAELYDELSRLRAARALDPKHGTRAGAPQCDDTCQICVAGIQLDLLIARMPRSPVPAIPEPTGVALDGIIDPPIGQYTIDSFFALRSRLWGGRGPALGSEFTPPWDVTSDDAAQDH